MGAQLFFGSGVLATPALFRASRDGKTGLLGLRRRLDRRMDQQQLLIVPERRGMSEYHS